MRFQLALFEQGSIPTIIWFVTTGALLYLMMVFWLGWQVILDALAAIGLQVLAIGAVLSSTSYLWRFG